MKNAAQTAGEASKQVVIAIKQARDAWRVAVETHRSWTIKIGTVSAAAVGHSKSWPRRLARSTDQRVAGLSRHSSRCVDR